MATHLKCYKDPKGVYLDKLKASAKNSVFFGGMKNYTNMTVFDNQYAKDGDTGGQHPDWALFWLKRYSKNDVNGKKVYLDAYKKNYEEWKNGRRVEQARQHHAPYVLTGVVGDGTVNHPPTVYLYEGYQGAQAKCRLWKFTP